MQLLQIDDEISHFLKTLPELLLSPTELPQVDVSKNKISEWLPEVYNNKSCFYCMEFLILIFEHLL